MCGITGFILNKLPAGRDQLLMECKRMTNRLSHRGPDDIGIWCDSANGIALGHRRLSVIDLSKRGRQPMSSHDDRYIFLLNGEIYNYMELRNDLSKRGFDFKSTSDTEVAICAIQHWGLEEALKKFVGMFAISLWDKKDSKLFLARDRMGEKPLYYGKFNNTFAFASELKALTAHSSWEGCTNRDAIALQLQYSYIPAPYSIYKDIYKLPPGSFIEIPVTSALMLRPPKLYWSFDNIVTSGIGARKDIREDLFVVDELEKLLSKTIQDKMKSDVPLGAFLSGGVDSSLVVALMKAHSRKPVRTFSIGFDENEYNEAHYANNIAKYLGTDHTELYVKSDDALSVIPQLPEIYDEPFSDSSQIPTYLISKLAKNDVTVALTGDGGDELFGGYNRYMVGNYAWNMTFRVPHGVRSVGSKLIHAIPQEYFDFICKPIRPFLPKFLQHKQYGQKLHKLANIWNTGNSDSLYSSLISSWEQPQEIILGAKSVDVLANHRVTLSKLDNFTERMMFADSVTYLPDDILVKVERASMRCSLEVRVPFLDHRIIEYIWKQPPNLKIRGQESKWLLKQVLNKYIPRKMTDRPKMGFGIPIDHWLRGPLKEWAGDLIAEDRLRRQGIMDPNPIQKKWQEHLSGQRSWQYLLWPVLMYQAWHDHWLN